MNRIIVSIQSFGDIITNSSSEILLYYEDSYIIDKNRNKI